MPPRRTSRRGRNNVAQHGSDAANDLSQENASTNDNVNLPISLDRTHNANINNISSYTPTVRLSARSPRSPERNSQSINNYGNHPTTSQNEFLNNPSKYGFNSVTFDSKTLIRDFQGKTKVLQDMSEYSTWKNTLVETLQYADILGCIYNSTPPPGMDVNDFNKRDLGARLIIRSAISESLQYDLLDIQNAYEMYKKLEEKSKESSMIQAIKLINYLAYSRLGDEESPDQFIRKLKTIRDKLIGIGITVPEQFCCILILLNLPENLKEIASTIKATPLMELTFSNLASRLESVVVTKRNQAPAYPLNNANQALIATHPRPRYYESRPKGKWSGYNNPHFKRRRRYRRPFVAFKHGKSSEKNPRTFANVATSRKPSEQVEVFGLLANTDLDTPIQDKNKIDFIVDSGATDHFISEGIVDVPEKGNLVSAVTGLNGNKLNYYSLRSVKLYDNKNNVLIFVRSPKLVDGAIFNLLSVAKLIKDGYSIEFKGNKCLINNSIWERPVVLYEEKGLFKWRLYLSNTDALQIQIEEDNHNYSLSIMKWHERLGHVNETQVIDTLTDKGIDIVTKEGNKTCIGCILAKMTKVPLKARNKGKANEVLDIIHSDLSGKIKPPSINGSQYYILFLDERSHYLTAYFLKKKSETHNAFLFYMKVLEKKFKRTPVAVFTDYGTEYENMELKNYLSSKGMNLLHSIPYRPELNGVIERMNRTISNSARALLINSGLNKRFWAEAVNCAVYTRNRVISSALIRKYNDRRTPIEIWDGNSYRLRLKSLRIFGCVCVIRVPNLKNKKLDKRGRKGIFVGYNNSPFSYRVYDPEKDNVSSHIDIRFIENTKSKDYFTSNMKYDFTINSPIKNQVLRTLNPKIISEITGIRMDDEINNNEEEIEESRKRKLKEMIESELKIAAVGNKRSKVENMETIPQNIDEALKSPYAEKWIEACKEELRSIHSHDVWILTENIGNKNVIPLRWVFTIKKNNEGRPEKFKARIVAKGFRQKKDIDYTETYSPVIRFEVIRLLLALATAQSLILYHLDVKTAFLHSKIDQETYVSQPPGFEIYGCNNLVLKLNKSLYGLKQSPLIWNNKLVQCLHKCGYVQNRFERSLFVKHTKTEQIYLGVYVDDLLLICKHESIAKRETNLMKNWIDIKFLGEVTKFLGVEIQRDLKNGTTKLSQKNYLMDVLKRVNYVGTGRGRQTPMDVGLQLKDYDEKLKDASPRLYHEIIGSLLYLATRTRPDITYSTNYLSRFTKRPQENHWSAVKQLLRYLSNSVDLCLVYDKFQNNKITLYSDADFASDINTRKSISGNISMLLGGAISWSSKLQNTIAQSTAEAELISLNKAGNEAIYLKNLCIDLKLNGVEPIVIYEDNQAAIQMAKFNAFHSRSKHIDLAHRKIQERITELQVEIIYCPTKEMLADIMTKSLSRKIFIYLRYLIGLK